MRPKVIIIGHSYTSRLGLVWALAEIDCEIIILSMVGPNPKGEGLEIIKDIDLYSKYISRVYFFGKSEDELMHLLLHECIDPNQRAILIPDSDFSSCVIDDHREELKQYYFFPTIKNGGTVKDWNDKKRQKDLARIVGLNVVDSISFYIKDGNYSLPKGIRYPCFPKAQSTIRGAKKGLERCDNEEQLHSVLKKMGREYDFQVMLEDYKEIENEYAVLGYSNGNEVVIPGMIEILDSCIYRPGIAKYGRVTGIEGNEDIVNKFMTFVRRLGFVGLFDIDFYRSGGKLFFSEINLRFGGSGYAITKMGANLPAMYVRNLIGQDTSGMNKLIQCNQTYINERLCMDDWYRAYDSTKQFFHYLKCSDIRFLDNPSDKGPKRAYERRLVKNYIKRFLKKCAGRL